MKWTDQTFFYQKVMHKVSEALHNPDSENYQGGWLYSEEIDGTPFEKYTNHFNRLVELNNSPVQRPIISARLRWVDADLHGRLINDLFLRDDGMVGSYQQTATNILWHSRGRALKTMNINNHISMKDFLSASPLTVLTGYATLRAWVKDEENAGKIVLGVNTQDKRQKWLSLSVDSLRKQWTRRLTWYLVRACMFYKGTSAERGTREFWSKDMNMPVEIYDFVNQNLDELEYFNDQTLHNFGYKKPYLKIVVKED